MQTCKYTVEDMARMCEIAVILSQYDVPCDDLHDFFTDHVQVIFDEWQNGKGIFLNDSEEGYITEYTNRIAKERYKKLC